MTGIQLCGGGPSGPPRRGLTTFAKATVVRRSFSEGGRPRPTSKPRTLRRAFRIRLRKQRFEESQAAWREVYGTAVRSARGPALFVDVPEQFSAQGAREVRTPLAPVEAGAAQRSSRARERCDVNPETAEESAAGIREHEATVRRVFVPVRFDDEQGARLEASEETHGQAAREMVVADACCSKLDVARTGLHDASGRRQRFPSASRAVRRSPARRAGNSDAGPGVASTGTRRPAACPGGCWPWKAECRPRARARSRSARFPT